jgi:hypothetical protein
MTVAAGQRLGVVWYTVLPICAEHGLGPSKELLAAP